MDQSTISATSRAAVLRAIEENIYGYWRMLAESGAIRVDEGDGLITYGPVEDIPFFNGVLRAQFASSEADRRIDETLERLGWPGSPVFWWMMPSSRPGDTGKRLYRRGFVTRSDFPAMAATLEGLPPVPQIKGLRVERVKTTDDLAACFEIQEQGFGMPLGLADAFREMFQRVGIDDPRWAAYLGLDANAPVATVTVVYAGGVAGLYGVATVAGGRRRGIASALTLASLHAARDAGYTLAVLRASELGFPVYQRMGFREYCRIPQHVWLPSR
jgi:GNAT superfamily N-acetyltransferase